MKIKKVHILLLILVSIQLGCKTSSPKMKYNNNDRAAEENLLFKIDSLEKELSRYQKDFEPGKVYSRCYVKAVFESGKSEKKYFVYTGVNKEQKGVSTIQYLFRPAYVEWVKVNSSEICSAYSDIENETCENWHLKEVSSVYRNEYIVVDTNKIKTFECRELDVERVVKEAYLTKIREFVCPLIFKQSLVGKIQKALRNKGYPLKGAKENILDEITKKSLKEYQKKNGLAIGNLNFETLKSLGVE